MEVRTPLTPLQIHRWEQSDKKLKFAFIVYLQVNIWSQQ